VRPLLDQPEATTGGLFAVGESYDACIRNMIDARAATQEDREQIATLLLGRLVPALQESGRWVVRCRVLDGDGTAIWKQVDLLKTWTRTRGMLTCRMR
jgi:hypothetical protein